jgi:hypothetical protein
MIHAFGMGSGAMIYMPSLIKIGYIIQTFLEEIRIQTHKYADSKEII